MEIQKEFYLVLESFKKNHPISLFQDKEVYADWLAQTYYFVIHSTSLLGYALPYLKNQNLRHHFEKHLGEETRHDLLALKDIERLGNSLSNFDEYSCTQAFYQSQYYRIAFEGATSLLGYILFLEGIAVHWGKDIHDQLKNQYPNSMLFLKVHAEEDPDHLESAIKTIQSLPIAEQEAIKRNLHYTAEIYSVMVDHVVAKREKRIAA